MHVIGDAADDLRDSMQTGNRAAEVFVEAGSPGWGDEGLALFRCEDQMVVQADKGRRHGGVLLDSWGRLQSCDPIRGRRRVERIVTGGIAPLNHRLQAVIPPGSGENTIRSGVEEVGRQSVSVVSLRSITG